VEIDIKFCPKCGSEDVVIDGTAIEFSAGAMLCKNCGFRDIVFPIKVKNKRIFR
jgi:transcription elongation factor Elf1